MRTIIAITCALFAFAAIAASTSARADDQRAKSEQYFRTGERLFNAGEFAAAAASFEDAYEILPLPAIAFSAAQAYRLAYVRGHEPARLKRAVELYRIYLEKVKTGERVTDATTALAELEPQLAQLEAGGRSIGGIAAVRQSGLMITSEVSPASGKIGADPKLAGALPLVRELPPGEYDVTVTAPGYAEKKIKASVIAGEMVPVEIDLVPLPAKIEISVEHGARVAVDGQVRGTTPLAPIPVEAGKHFVAIEKRGRYAIGRQIDLDRGGTTKVDPKLRTTAQRKAARWVMIGSGVLVVGTGLAGLGAWQSDKDAAKIDAKRTTTGITPDEVARYDKLRAQKSDRLDMTYALGGAALVVGTTGVLMYLFDHHEAEAPLAPLTVAPTVSAASAGVVVQGSF